MPNIGDSKPSASEFRTVMTRPDERAIERAGEMIRAGKLVAFPTETVYGLGADATNGEAVAKIFAAKGRPSFNPLIVHAETRASAKTFGLFTPAAEQIASHFWPGPLTIVVMRQTATTISHLVSAGLDTLALRVPDHPVAQNLLRISGRPLAAPSANRSGHVSATHAEHVAADLGAHLSMILDGGPTHHGLESTVIDATGEDIVLLRPGAISAADIEKVIGTSIQRPASNAQAPSSPGQLESHYAPTAALRLNAQSVTDGEALLAFGAHPLTATGPVINLSVRADLIEAAANLFAALRTLDATGVASIAVMPIPSEGIGEAINDRLKRAAAPRS